MNATLILRIVIIAYTAVFAIYWIADCIKHKEEFTGKKVISLLLIVYLLLLQSALTSVQVSFQNFL